jgi:hypothetical protein
VLQNGSAVVKALSDEDSEAGRDRLSAEDIRRAPAALEVHIDPDFEGFVVADFAQLVVKGAHCFVSPVELRQEASQGMSRVVVSHALPSR